LSRKHPVPHEEQLRLVYECRNSGLSDSQWCRQHGIATSTFSNWVIRNKKRGDIIPDPVSAEEYWPDAKPDIVQVNLVSDAAYVEKKVAIPATRELSHSSAPQISTDAAPTVFQPGIPVLEIELRGAKLRITNDIDPNLLAQTVQILRGAVC
jgi:transposase-like protein